MLEGVVVDVVQLVEQVAVVVAAARFARTGTVLINRPTIESTPATSAGRPETTAPKATSRWPVSHISSCAQAAWQHGADGGVVRARQLASGPRGLLEHPHRCNVSPPRPEPVRRADQSRGVKTGQHLAP